MSIKKIFITGATGYIGGSIAKLLVDKGYKVSGLVRKESDTEKLKELGINPVLGTLQDAPLLREESKKADAIIHAADADDPYVIDTFLQALKGTDKTFIHTSGSSILGNKENGEKSNFIYTEDIPLDARFEKVHRVIINNHIIKSAQQRIRSIVIVPTMIYGEGLGLKKESIQIPMLLKLSKERGAGVHIESGENIWSNVHIEDLAELYLKVLEKAKAGSYFYAENGESSLRDIALSISKRIGREGQLSSISIDEAVSHFGSEGAYFALGSNSRCSSDKARQLLGWTPNYSSIHDFI
ncbi:MULTISPECIES: NAD-dependent epimerase/dehydratase family protein [Olivibacter]|jgi:nucleoside-diphosphate-sugar epimerase|uniref:NAD-dependent epimerase/dehydratase family protein n=1 Tax=Olivibacter oleidegradans TaxID=760123 RepID=A0ABV6HRU5_9SPHI|nr:MULTISPECIES: NAD-dependent epimerase/dehydratase family protein [Olivibacter]MDM8176258.1 NAD-dependent epimerase/dehydratase family protein [Olivibacter sp. 47]